VIGQLDVDDGDVELVAAEPRHSLGAPIRPSVTWAPVSLSSTAASKPGCRRLVDDEHAHRVRHLA